MTLLADRMKQAGVGTNSALLHVIAVEHLRRNGCKPKQAVKTFTDEVRDAGGIIVALMGDVLSYLAVREVALEYLSGIAADMKNSRVERDGGVRPAIESQHSDGSPEQNEGAGVHLGTDGHHSDGPALSSTNLNDAVQNGADSQLGRGRVVPAPNKSRRNAESMRAARETTTSIFDTYKLPSGHVVARTPFHMLSRLRTEHSGAAALIGLLQDSVSNPDPHKTPADYLSEKSFQKLVQRAAEVSDAA